MVYMCNAQNRSNQDDNRADLARYIIVEQEGQPTHFSSFLVKDKVLPSDQRFIRREEALKRYQHKVNSGSALIVKLLPNAKVYTLHELFKRYNVSPKYHNLPVVVDEILVRYPQSLLAVNSAIVYIKPVSNWRSIGNVLYIRTVNPIAKGAVR